MVGSPGEPTESLRIATTSDVSANVSMRLRQIAKTMPQSIAVACPGRGDVAGTHSYATCSFAELDADASALARGLVDLGVEPHDRLALLVRPGIEFVKLVFAVLRSGATMVMIDPGMGRSHLVRCLSEVEPTGFVAISAAQAVRSLLRRRFPGARKNVTVGGRWFWGGPSYRQLLTAGRQSTTSLPEMEDRDPAAIIFTSGSTGPPKGVLYTHEMFATQAEEIKQQYGIQSGGADLACFPLFGLFNSVMGVTTVFPKMNFSRPASADPAKLLHAAQDWRVTQAFASPAVWNKLSRHCQRHGLRIATLRKVFSCGAPVPADVLQRTLDSVDPLAEMHTPYGATESLPIATITASEVLLETRQQTEQGAGVCVGRKFDTIEWRVIRIDDGLLGDISEVEDLPPGEIGELLVRGPQVSPAYVSGDSDHHNRLAKIADGDTVWHRLGDVGYFDEVDRFWYCGRKAHRVQTSEGTVFTIPCEAIFNTHPEVARSAIVGIGPVDRATPILIVEPVAELQQRFGKRWAHARYHQLMSDLLQEASAHELTRPIKQILLHPSLPVDVRHNSKIHRESLADWAEVQLARHRQLP